MWLGKIVSVSGQFFKLEREVALAKPPYDSYRRNLQGIAVEDLTSSANIRVLEEPYIQIEHQDYMPGLAAAAACFLLWVAIEFYRLGPPLGKPHNMRETDG